jgi:3-methyladenine DNA glycosylase Tag
MDQTGQSPVEDPIDSCTTAKDHRGPMVDRRRGGLVRAFSEIIAMAAEQKGGLDAIETMLADTPAVEPAVIVATPDDRILAAMTRRIFNAGFSSKVIDAKWDAFEAAFEAFDPPACAFMTPDRFDLLMKDRNIVRNGAKIRSVQLNAKFVLDLAADHGGAGRFFADWPDADYVGLLGVLKQRGNHLGGDSGMRFLRSIGKPAFIPTKDVVAALIREGVLERAPGGKKDFAAIQQACNQWSAQSGRNLTEISRILAMSVGVGDAGAV